MVSERTGKPISLETLFKHFRTELDSGKADATYEVINALFDKAVNGDTTAAIWWTKTQCGWHETTNVNVNVNVNDECPFDRMSEEEPIEAIEEQANRLGVKMNFADRMKCRSYNWRKFMEA
jgi:hypothetical protein